MPHSPSLVQQANSSQSETDTNSSQKGDDSTLRDVTSDKPITDVAGVTETPLDPLHDEFVSTTYPNIQGNLKLKTDDPKLAVEPDSSTGTLASFKNLDTYGDQFLVDKPNESEVEKLGDEREEVISMVDVTIIQDTSPIPTLAAPTPDEATTTTGTSQGTATLERSTSTTKTSTPPTAEMKPSPGLEDVVEIATGIVQDNLTINEKLTKHESVLRKIVDLDLPQTLKNHNTRLSKL